jgi:hypothetical protein
MTQRRYLCDRRGNQHEAGRGDEVQRHETCNDVINGAESDEVLQMPGAEDKPNPCRRFSRAAVTDHSLHESTSRCEEPWEDVSMFMP